MVLLSTRRCRQLVNTVQVGLICGPLPLSLTLTFALEQSSRLMLFSARMVRRSQRRYLFADFIRPVLPSTLYGFLEPFSSVMTQLGD